MYYSKGVWVSHRRGQDDDDVKSARIDLARRQVDRDENVNGKRGTLKNVRRDADGGVDDDPEAHFSQGGSGDKVVSICLFFRICSILIDFMI